MRINVEIDEDAGEAEIIIRCRERDAYIERLISALQITDRRITVIRDRDTMLLGLEDVLYIESVDRKCFVYTSGEVYGSASRLYELEQQLARYMFVRINKSAIVNLKNIRSIKTYVNRRLLITMVNGEELIVSRQYADNIKGLLGVG